MPFSGCANRRRSHRYSRRHKAQVVNRCRTGSQYTGVEQPAGRAHLHDNVTNVAPAFSCFPGKTGYGATEAKYVWSPAGDEVRIIDTGPAVARQLQRRLSAQRRAGAAGGGLRLFTSGDPESFSAVARRLWPGAPAATAID